MHKIALIQFPGTNCEYESFRAIKQAGMSPSFFRWNKNAEELRSFDGYFIPGGFSYEDRVRSGAIAARDPIMTVIAEEAAKGKPVIGICNGAQILVESGMIPGLNSNHLGAALAWNEKGYLNIKVRIKNEAAVGRSFFNDFQSDHHFGLPIAHGEGRFILPEDLLAQLQDRQQILFRYCDKQGQVVNEFPINPNGSQGNIAGLCNPAGNILALMPHPERVEGGQVIFESMKKSLDDRKKAVAQYDLQHQEEFFDLKKYEKPKSSLEFLVDLIITDNEAQTLQIALSQLGFGQLQVKRFTHYEIQTDREDRQELAADLIKSGELLNTNKEIAYVFDQTCLNKNQPALLVRYCQDFEGQGRLATLEKRLGFSGLQSIKKGTLWQIDCSPEQWQKIICSNILYNPYSQQALTFEI